MDGFLKQSTSVDVPIGPFLDATDGVTAEGALTITQPDIRLKKNGGAWAQKAAAQTLNHEENGNYEVTLDATDTNTLGILRLHVNETGALPVWHSWMVLPANVYDSLVSGSDALDVSAIQFAGQTITCAGGVTIPAATLASTTNITAGTIATVTNLTNAPTSGDLTATMKASVNAEVLDVLNTDTFAEPAQGTPGATITLAAKIGFIYKFLRNKLVQTSTQISIYNDDAATVDHKSTISTAGTTYTKGEFTTGP